jgi:hypothetical protein
MKYQLKEFNRNIPDIELLEDLKKVAKNLGISKISSRQYDGNGGKYTADTLGVRFGSWNNALEKAGLTRVLKHNPTEIELFKDIEKVWIKLGRQPVSRDFKRPLSEFSPSAYINKFGTFRNALEAFIEYINMGIETPIVENIPEIVQKIEIIKHKTSRLPSERLKVQVLMRDGNKCRLCGITLNR